MGRHLQHGQALFELRRYREVVEACNEELSHSPQSAEAFALRAAALVNLRQERSAARDVKQALGINPLHAFSFYILSYVEGNARRLKQAEAAIAEALRIDPRADYFHRLGELQLARNRLMESLASIETALSLDPRHIQSLCLRAHLLMQDGQAEEARAVLLSALSVHAGDAGAQHALGALELQTGTSREAIEFLREARRLSPLAHNDRDAIASAYGRMLWPFRHIDALKLRYHYWSPGRRWALLAATATFLAAVSVTIPPAGIAALAIYLVMFNGLALPTSADMAALTAGKVFYRRDLDLRWRQLVPEAIRVVFPLVSHGIASCLAIGCAAEPVFALMILGVAPSFEFLFRIARAPSLVRKFGLFWLAAFAIFTPALTCAMLWNDSHEPAGTAIGWCVTMALSCICTVLLR